MQRSNSAVSAISLAIIAGGKSRRMGQEKAFLELGGKTLIERVNTCRYMLICGWEALLP